MINIEEHLGLARKVSYQFYKNSKNKYSYDEIESTAFLGLIEAAKKFDESRDVKFSTYAIHVITGRVKRMYRDDKWYFVKRGVPQEMLSVNFVINPSNNVEMQEILEDEENVEENVINKLTIKRLFNLLNERDKKIVYLYFYKQLSQSQISIITGLSQPHVSRIILNSLKKMKNELAA